MTSTIKRALKSFVALLFEGLALVIPKRRNLWVFHSFPSFSDNSRAIYDFMRREHPDYRLIWLTNRAIDPIVAHPETEAFESYSWKSLKGLYYSLRAKVFITTHTMPSFRNTRGQLFCNLWHGMPFKSAGIFSPEWSASKKHAYANDARNIDLMIATSSVTRAGQSMQFAVPPDRFVITGQPRTDALFHQSSSALTLLRKELLIPPHSRVVVMLPTFRDGNQYGIVDGVPLHEQFQDSVGVAQLTEALQLHNAHIIIKPHPFDLTGLQNLGLGNRIHLLDDQRMRDYGVNVYNLLAVSDALITDYSSVYIDYVMLDRPLLFFVSDFEQYTKNRQFVFEPFDFWTPGPKSHSLTELAEHVTQLLSGEDTHSKHRQLVQPLLHEHVDDRSSARFVADIMKRI